MILKKIINFVMIASLVTFCSGCSLLGAALSAGVAYGIYQATHK